MAHTFSQILLHVVFSTSGRRNLIAEAFRPRLYEYMGGVARNEFGAPYRIGGTANHVHALIGLRTNVSVADAVAKLKSHSSGWLHKTFPTAADFAWQGGYAAFSVSTSKRPEVIEYIDNQMVHHNGRTFEEEFRALLDAHGIEYDAAHFLD
jgi:REP element-mobilizing transposase RayT